MAFLFTFICHAVTQSAEHTNNFPKPTINILDRTNISNNLKHPVAFSKIKFYKSLRNSDVKLKEIQAPEKLDIHKNINLIIGTLKDSIIKSLFIKNRSLNYRLGPESVVYLKIETENRPILVITGSDSRGLQYALNELSQRIDSYGLRALYDLESYVESPENTVRGVDRFIKDVHDNSWFFSGDFWNHYLNMLAINRFNRLTLITGYNDGKSEDFMIPVYPYLFQVPGFNQTELKRTTEKSPAEYLRQLKHIGKLCKNYGIEFVFGIWGHGRHEKLVGGLPKDSELYTQYCAAGIRKLLREVPEIDGIQLRVNYESGVGGFGETADFFWKEIIMALGDSNKERNGKLFLDIRAKGLTKKISKWASQTGINFSVTSKYSWEGMGLPYHPTQMRKGELALLDNIDKRQRYGYANFLNESRNFDFIYRLWGIGTLRLFTWADPDYAKRFARTTTFGNAKGFQITPPMSRKNNTWPLFNRNNLAYFNWEYQRYWAYYLLFGRLGYASTTNPIVWEREFEKHYGLEYKQVLKAYVSASKILPLITSSHLTYHPANYNWAEMDSGGALFVEHNANLFFKNKKRTYQSSEPGDPGIFYTISDYVNDGISNTTKRKITPIQLSAIFEKLSLETQLHLSKINKEHIPDEYKTEFSTNLADLEILSSLSMYHAFKIKAATHYALYEHTQDYGYLKSCLANMKKVRSNWTNIVTKTSEVYYKQPLFLHDNGTWEDRLIEIEQDINKLESLTSSFSNVKIKSHWQSKKTSKLFERLHFEAVIPDSIKISQDVEVGLTPLIKKLSKSPQIHFRLADMTLGSFKTLDMTWNGTNYTAQIPTSGLDPNYDLLLYFTYHNTDGFLQFYPGLFNDTSSAPYYCIELFN